MADSRFMIFLDDVVVTTVLQLRDLWSGPWERLSDRGPLSSLIPGSFTKRILDFELYFNYYFLK